MKVLQLILFFLIFYSCSDQNYKSKLDPYSKPCGFRDNIGWHSCCDYPNSEKGLVTIEGKKIWVEIEGDGDPLLLIQGGPLMDHRYFHPLFKSLSKNHTLIYADLCSRLQSDPCNNGKNNSHQCGLMADVEQYEKLRKALNISEWDILGHSFGGYIALTYAKQFPKAINKTVVTGTPIGITPKAWDSVKTKIMEKHYQNIQSREDNIRVHLETDFYKKPDSTTLKYYRNTLWDYNNYKKFKKLNTCYFEETKKDWKALIGDTIYKLDEDFYNIERPLLFLSGKNDPLVLLDYTKKNVKRFPNSRHKIIKNAGHNIWFEQPDLFFKEINNFLQE